jgi:hypothetical protein
MVSPMKSGTNVLGVAFALFFVACGDDTPAEGTGEADLAEDTAVSDGSGESDTGTADTGNGDVAVTEDSSDDLGVADESTGRDADAPVEGEEIVGGVTVFEIRAPDVEALRSGGIAAGFVLREPDEEASHVATIGPCNIDATDPDAELFPSVDTLDAGEITVDLGDDVYHLTIAETAEGPRYEADTPEGLIEYFAAGLTIEVSAAGGADINAFAGSVSAPLEPVITQPSWSGGFDGTHDQDSPLVVNWASTELGLIDVIISVVPIETIPTPGIADGHAITCVVPDTGSYTIPTAALDYLPGNFAIGPNVALTVIVPVSETFEVGHTEVTINATASHSLIGKID